tara:strand:+ start:201 stop:605 length:405 start_codon:yes stop_codon:yes gene_type:complete
MGQFRCDRCEQTSDSRGGDAIEDPNNNNEMIHESCLTDREIEEGDGTREHWNANKAADTTDEWLLGERPMSNIIEKNGMAALLEELLEKTRQEIVDQECMIAKNIHPINFKPSLPKLEQILEQALIDERGQDDE